MALSPYASTSASATHGAIVPIQKITLTSNGGFTFNNVPQTYQDLFVVGNMRGLYAATFDVVLLQWGYTQTYNYMAMRGQGSSVDSYRGTGAYGLYCNSMPAASTNSNAFGGFEAYIPNYAQSNTRKTVLVKQSFDVNNSGGITYTIGSRNITDAVTMLELGGGNNAIAAGSTATLYGIRTINQ
jgi:hypothetical protein